MFPENWQSFLPDIDWPDWSVPDWPWEGGENGGNGTVPGIDGDGDALNIAAAIQTSVLRAGGIYARQLGGIAIRGKGLPGLWTPGGQVVSHLRLGERAVSAATKITPRAVSPLRAFLDDLASRGISRFVGESAAKQAFPKVTIRAISATGAKVPWTTGVKAFTPTVARLGIRAVPKTALRAIPVVGWALSVVDIGADIARIFGADVTEWLGFSGIAEPFLGYNPLERWFSAPPVSRVQASQMGVPFAPSWERQILGGLTVTAPKPTYKPYRGTYRSPGERAGYSTPTYRSPGERGGNGGNGGGYTLSPNRPVWVGL